MKGPGAEAGELHTILMGGGREAMNVMNSNGLEDLMNVAGAQPVRMRNVRTRGTMTATRMMRRMDVAPAWIMQGLHFNVVTSRSTEGDVVRVPVGAVARVALVAIEEEMNAREGPGGEDVASNMFVVRLATKTRGGLLSDGPGDKDEPTLSFTFK